MDDEDEGTHLTIREKMVAFLRKHYSETLGEDAALLDHPEGLRLLHEKYCGNRS